MEPFTVGAAAGIYIIFAMDFFQFALKMKDFFDKDSTHFSVQDRQILINLEKEFNEFKGTMKERQASFKKIVNKNYEKLNKFETWLSDIKRHTSPSNTNSYDV